MDTNIHPGKRFLISFILALTLLASACTPASTNTPAAQAPANTPVAATPATAASPATDTPIPSAGPTATLAPEAAYTVEQITPEIHRAYMTVVQNVAVPIDKAKLATAALTGLADALRLKDEDRADALNVTFGDDTEANFTILKERFETLFKKYGTGKLPITMMHAMLTQMALAVGDQHTYFLTPEMLKAELAELNAESSFTGIGVSIRRRDQGGPVVVEVFPGSPAEKGGMKPGDVLTKVDERDITKPNIDYVKMIRGPEGTNVTITVERVGESQPLNLTITRGKIAQQILSSRVVGDNIGYIRIYSFASTADTPLANKVSDALKALEPQHIKGLIIDLRDNPGGYLEPVQQIAGLFIPNPDRSRTLGYFRDGKGKETPIPLLGKAWPTQYPLVVLVNQASGSGAEVLPLAMQEYKVAYLIGQKTAGAVGSTNSSAHIVMLDKSELWYTANVIYGPVSRTTPNQKGVEPDLEIPNPSPDDLINARDPQLDAGINYLKDKLK